MHFAVIWSPCPKRKKNYEDRTIIDHSSGEISTADAAVLLDAVREGLENETYKFYVGTSYRHLLIWDRGEVVELTQRMMCLVRRLVSIFRRMPYFVK